MFLMLYMYICFIYIYFYILRRFIISGLRYGLNVSRKIIAVSRVVLRCMRGALWGFIKIINITFLARNQIASIYQFGKLVAECRLRHSHSLPYGSGRERKHKSVCIGGKV